MIANTSVFLGMAAVNTSESVAGLTRLQLENWERSVKARDDEMLASPIPEHVDLPPPRRHIEIGRPDCSVVAETKKSAPEKAESKTSSSAGAPEGGKGKKSDEDSPESKMLIEEAKKHAEKEKAAGNDHFKAKRWNEAVECYTRAMKYDSSNSVYPANRAMCYLKLGKIEDAEKDCTTALRLDPKYTKAYYRRATARKQQGKYVLALDDLNLLLRYEPENKQAIEEKRIINELLAQKLHIEESASDDAESGEGSTKEAKEEPLKKDELKEVETRKTVSDEPAKKVLIQELPSSVVSDDNTESVPAQSKNESVGPEPEKPKQEEKEATKKNDEENVAKETENMASKQKVFVELLEKVSSVP